MSDVDPWVLRLPTFDASGETEHITMRQVVAYNVTEGRQRRGWSQKDLAEALKTVTGRPWTSALVSAAESGWAGSTGRVRSFDVNDVVAFSLALRLPVSWFFLPPPVTPMRTAAPEGPWITCARRSPEPLITSETLRYLALARDDPGDDRGLMDQRVRVEADEAPAMPPEFAGGLYELAKQLYDQLESQRKEEE